MRKKPRKKGCLNCEIIEKSLILVTYSPKEQHRTPPTLLSFGQLHSLRSINKVKIRLCRRNPSGLHN